MTDAESRFRFGIDPGIGKQAHVTVTAPGQELVVTGVVEPAPA